MLRVKPSPNILTIRNFEKGKYHEIENYVDGTNCIGLIVERMRKPSGFHGVRNRS